MKPSLPKPTGPYRVGLWAFAQTVPVQIYFPLKKGEHCFNAKRYEPLAPGYKLEVDVYACEANFSDLAVEGAPLVFLNHGHMVAMTDYGIIAEELASHGYIVVAMQHQLATDLIEPDYLEERSVAKYSAIIDNIFHLFVWLQERIEVRRVGFVGHSMGANALLLLFHRASTAFKPKQRASLLPGTSHEAIVALDPGGFPYPPRSDYPLFLGLSEERQRYHEQSGSLAQMRAIGHTVRHYKGSKHISFMDWGWVEPPNPVEPGVAYFGGSEGERIAFFNDLRGDIRHFLAGHGVA